MFANEFENIWSSQPDEERERLRWLAIGDVPSTHQGGMRETRAANLQFRQTLHQNDGIG